MLVRLQFLQIDEAPQFSSDGSGVCWLFDTVSCVLYCTLEVVHAMWCSSALDYAGTLLFVFCFSFRLVILFTMTTHCL